MAMCTPHNFQGSTEHKWTLVWGSPIIITFLRVDGQSAIAQIDSRLYMHSEFALGILCSKWLCMEKCVSQLLEVLLGHTLYRYNVLNTWAFELS